MEKFAVVMAGGRGTRFWPRSREKNPKQFLALMGGKTLLNQTVDRLHPDFKPDNIFIVTTEDLAQEALRLVPEIPSKNLIVEPEGRNTAPCLALALCHLERKFSDGLMAVLAADHFIADAKAFLEDINLAASHAINTHDLITFGIRPTYPETGYGYIETEGQGKVLKVMAFKEKPPLETAVKYTQSGRHFWNSGMFVWTLNDMRRELMENAPDILKPLDAWVTAGADPRELYSVYAGLPKTSIDYALMEKSKHVTLVTADFPWSDVGSWPAVAAFHSPDESSNVIVGDAILVDSRNCVVFGNKRLVAASGLEDIIIVDEEDSLLICHKDKAQGVKEIVDRLHSMGRRDLL